MVRDSVVKGRSEEQAADTVSFCVNSYKFVYTNHTERLCSSLALLQEVSSIELLQHRLKLAD